MVVNLEQRLPKNYVPEGLVSAYGVQGASEAMEALKNMLAFVNVSVVSGYRSYERQKELFEAKKREPPYSVMPPGASEHQTGLAFDISNGELEESFAYTAEGIWLRENAHKFGFILRYPKGKENITGVIFEPWHFRYVGKYAKEIFTSGKTLEEYVKGT